MEKNGFADGDERPMTLAEDLLRRVTPFYEGVSGHGGRRPPQYPIDRDGERWCKSCGWQDIGKFTKGDGHGYLRRECQVCRAKVAP